VKAAYLSDGAIHVGEVADPTPSEGTALVRVHSCGLCASDAHWLQLGPELVETSRRYGGPYAGVDLGQRIVMGHEFVGEIVDYGPGGRRPLPLGTRVTSIPVVRRPDRSGVIGQAEDLPGGFGEYLLVDETFMQAVPDGVPDEHAAMVEPLAVGLEHARSGHPTADDTVLVVGCGAIGLGVIVGLKLKGIGPVIASDFDRARRELAIRMGADAAIDPREQSPYEAVPGVSAGAPTLIYECVGAPGMLSQLMRAAGFGTRVVIGGFCLEPEQIYVPNGQTKRLTLHFAAGEEPQDMDLALRTIAEGKIDIDAWIGARIGLGEVGAALTAMRDPAAPVRTVVDPRRT